VGLPTGGTWAYWMKVGMVIRSGRGRVRLSVPLAWRSRAAITWGSLRSAQSVIVFDGCPAPPVQWLGYAGGLFLDSPAMCLPLIVKVGSRRTVARFAIGGASCD
jgi:hypothetical protein